MIIPSNIYLNDSTKAEYEKFIKDNRDRIKGVLLLLSVEPFSMKVDLKEYYTYMTYIIKKYNIHPIGFFDEKKSFKIDVDLKENIAQFQKQFQEFYDGGIRTIIRPYYWYQYDFFNYKDLKFFISSEENRLLLNRTLNVRLFFDYINYLVNGIEKDTLKYPRVKSAYEKRISFGHPDATYDGKIFYELLKKSDEEFISELDDIYFAKDFIYDDGVKSVLYGNVMGVSASDEQVDYLFKIQEELGVTISLTFNAINPPAELVNDANVLKAFITFLKKFYKRGLRVVTISDIHLIKTGVLQREFPEMKFKNTVNHKITDTQSFINFCNIGYDYIQLDRSLVRDMNELKKIAKANKKYKKKLYLLGKEFCMYSCPFKDEHDHFNTQMNGADNYFLSNYKRSYISCDNWRFSSVARLPRIGVDIYLKDKEMLDEYLKYVDVIKLSGRLMNLSEKKQEDREKLYINGYKSLNEFIQNDSGAIDIQLNPNDNSFDYSKLKTKEGQKLLDLLTYCKNQCYDCHKCEDVYGVKRFDSLVELRGEYFD